MWTHLLRVSSLEMGNALAKAQINKSPLLAEYRNHPKLAKRHGFCILRILNNLAVYVHTA